MILLKYIVTKNIETPNKVAMNIMVFDFLFVICYMAIAFALKSIVYDSFQVLYLIFSFLMAIFLTSKSLYNRERRNFESIFLMLKNNKTVYTPFLGGELDEKE